MENVARLGDRLKRGLVKALQSKDMLSCAQNILSTEAHPVMVALFFQAGSFGRLLHRLILPALFQLPNGRKVLYFTSLSTYHVSTHSSIRVYTQVIRRMLLGAYRLREVGRAGQVRSLCDISTLRDGEATKVPASFSRCPVWSMWLEAVYLVEQGGTLGA